jgi:hypothetical protein
MLERVNDQWLVVPDRSRVCERSSNALKSGGPEGDEQDLQDDESPHASQPPERRERMTERMASTTTAKMISDMTMVASVPVGIPCSISQQTNPRTLSFSAS